MSKYSFKDYAVATAVLAWPVLICAMLYSYIGGGAATYLVALVVAAGLADSIRRQRVVSGILGGLFPVVLGVVFALFDTPMPFSYGLAVVLALGLTLSLFVPLSVVGYFFGMKSSTYLLLIDEPVRDFS